MPQRFNSIAVVGAGPGGSGAWDWDWEHLRYLILPVITLSGVLMGLVLAGSVPVERAFATPGLGFAMFTAVNERDVFVMQNLVFLYSIVFVLLNILVDLTIAWLDPRIRYQ